MNKNVSIFFLKQNQAIKILSLLALLSFFISCASIQREIYISAPEKHLAEEISRIERDIIMLDFQDIEAEAKGNKNYQLSEVMYKNIQYAIQDLIETQYPSENTKAHLYALKGRLELLFSKTQNASAQKKAAFASLKEAEKYNANDIQVFVLKKRLGEMKSFTSSSVQADRTGILMVELAIDAFLKAEYTDALTLFDTAFLITEPMYKNTYMPLRTMSWNLKDVSTAENKDLLKLMSPDALSVVDMIQIIDDNSLAFQSSTGGKKYKPIDLFLHIQNLGYLNPSSKLAGSEPSVPVKEKDIATRRLGARLLWNLYIVKTSKQNQKNSYSDSYRGRIGSRSPIFDISLDDEDFDAILGCVEKEFLNLEDGSSFYPDKIATTLDILEWIHSF